VIALYNFDEILRILNEHDWSRQPFVCLLGPPKSGKSRIIRELLSLRSKGGFGSTIFIDAESMTDEISIGRAALTATARNGALPRTRTRLTAAAGKVVIESSLILNGEMSIDTGNSRAVMSTLLDELAGTAEPLMVIIDHEQEASPEAREFVRALASHVAINTNQSLSLLIVHTLVSPEQVLPAELRRGAAEPFVVRMHALGASQVLAWGRQLGLPLGDDGARVIHADTHGWAGEVYSFLARLLLSDTYTRRRRAND
jgi:hypothetical protein